MGNSESQEKEIALKENNQWYQYEAHLAKDKLSEFPPYHLSELEHLEGLFTTLDKKNLKSIELNDFDQIAVLK